MTDYVKGNCTNGEMLQEALKTGRAFGGGWRKLENKLGLCLGIAGKQQFSHSNVNIFFIIARMHHLEALLGYFTVLYGSMQNCKIEFFIPCWYIMWLFLKWQNWQSDISVWSRLFIYLASVKPAYTCQIFQNISDFWKNHNCTEILKGCFIFLKVDGKLQSYEI